MKTNVLKKVLLFAALAAECASAAAKPVNVAWVQGNASLQAVVLIRSGFTKYVQDNKITDWNVSYSDGKGSAEIVATNIQDAVSRGVDAIFISAADLRSSNASLKAAAKAHIPVLSTDSGSIPGSTVDITSNNWSMSADVSVALINKLNGKGNLVILTSDAILPVRERADTLKAVLKEFPNIKVVAEHSLANGNFYQDATNAMQDYVTRFGNTIDGVWTGWDEPAGAAAAVLKKANLNVPVTGMDGLKFAVDGVCDPKSPFYATSRQQFVAWGAKLAELTQRLVVKGEPESQVLGGVKTIYFPTELLTKQDCKKG